MKIIANTINATIRQCLQNQITYGMTVRVVNVLKVIRIYHKQAERAQKAIEWVIEAVA